MKVTNMVQSDKSIELGQQSKRHASILRNSRLSLVASFSRVRFLLCGYLRQFITSATAKCNQSERGFHAPFLASGRKLIPSFWNRPLGRDMLSRVVFGVRVSLTIVVLVLAVGGFIGTAAGIISGYRGGWTDVLIMRAVDATLAFPIILLALLLAGALKEGTPNVVIALSAVVWARFARVIRGEVLSLRKRDFVALARIGGRSDLWIMAKHIFPNVVNTLVVMLTLQVGWVIVVKASLSFLGAGVPHQTLAWAG